MSRQPVAIVSDHPHYVSTIVKLAWPIFIEQLLVSMVQAADSAMVGSLGAAATASVAINSSPNVLINGIILAMGIGFTSLIARNIGAGNVERAKHLTKQAITTVIAVMLPLSILCYLLARQIPIWMGGEAEILDNAEIYNKILALSLVFRGMTMVLTAIYRGYGDSKTPMIINTMVNILNVIGNFFMIYPTREMTLWGHSFTMFGFGWGVPGAAISTSLSGILGGIILFIHCFVKKSEMKISLRGGGFAPDKYELSRVWEISFPATLERFVMGAAFIVVGRCVASLGTAAVAAQNLSGTAEAISFMPAIAFGTATTTLFGQCIGAKRDDMAQHYVRDTIKIGAVIMFFTSLLLYFGATPIMRIFTPDAEVVRLGTQLLEIVAVIQVPQVIAMIHSGALKGAGDAKSPFLICLISMWGIRLLGTYLCIRVFHMGLASASVCMCLDNAVRSVMFYLRYRQGAWKKHMDKL